MHRWETLALFVDSDLKCVCVHFRSEFSVLAPAEYFFFLFFFFLLQD